VDFISFFMLVDSWLFIFITLYFLLFFSKRRGVAIKRFKQFVVGRSDVSRLSGETDARSRRARSLAVGRLGLSAWSAPVCLGLGDVSLRRGTRQYVGRDGPVQSGRVGRVGLQTERARVSGYLSESGCSLTRLYARFCNLQNFIHFFRLFSCTVF